MGDKRFCGAYIDVTAASFIGSGFDATRQPLDSLKRQPWAIATVSPRRYGMNQNNPFVNDAGN
jgi:hypothetical protein